MLLDTGSAVTLLRLDIWNQCKNDSNTLDQWSGPKLVGVNGTPLQVMGHCKINISLSHVSVIHPILVVDSLLAQGILGLDFLQNNNCSVNLTKGSCILYVGSNKVPLLSSIVPKEEHNPVSVIVAQTMHIPERSEKILAIVKEGTANDGRTYLLEGLEGSKSLALVAQAVVSPINNTVIVRVSNPQKDPIIIHRNAKIAVMEEVDTVCVAVAAGSYKSEDSTQRKSEKHQILWKMAQNCQTTVSESEKGVQFLLNFEDVFAGPDDPLGRTSLLKHSIDTASQCVECAHLSVKKLISCLRRMLFSHLVVLGHPQSSWSRKKMGPLVFAWIIVS